jgi:hypothetical protein
LQGEGWEAAGKREKAVGGAGRIGQGWVGAVQGGGPSEGEQLGAREDEGIAVKDGRGKEKESVTTDEGSGVCRRGSAWAAEGVDTSPWCFFVIQEPLTSVFEVGELLGAEAQGVDLCRVGARGKNGFAGAGVGIGSRVRGKGVHGWGCGQAAVEDWVGLEEGPHGAGGGMVAKAIQLSLVMDRVG